MPSATNGASTAGAGPIESPMPNRSSSIVSAQSASSSRVAPEDYYAGTGAVTPQPLRNANAGYAEGGLPPQSLPANVQQQQQQQQQQQNSNYMVSPSTSYPQLQHPYHHQQNGGYRSGSVGVGPSSSVPRHSYVLEADREARRERRARIEKQVQAALFEQRAQHTTAVSGLKTQLLELKHQDELAALRHQAKARESTLEQELANVQRLLEEERNRRSMAEDAMRRALEGQRSEAERRDAAESALSAALADQQQYKSRSSLYTEEDVVELQRRFDATQRQLAAAKASQEQIERAHKERSIAAVSAEAAAAEQLKQLEETIANLRDAKAKEAESAAQRLTAEKSRHTESVKRLEEAVASLEKSLAETESARESDRALFASKEKSLMDTKAKEVRAAEAKAEREVTAKTAEVQRLEEALEDERLAVERLKDLMVKKEESETQRKAKYAQEKKRLEEEHSAALEELTKQIAAVADERDKAVADLALNSSQSAASASAALALEAAKRDKSVAEAKVAQAKANADALEEALKAAEARVATLQAEHEAEAEKAASKLYEAEKNHKEAIASLNKKLREAWASAKEAEEKADEWDRALRDANDRIEADTKALDQRYNNLVAAHARDQEKAKEQISILEENVGKARLAFEEALAAERAAHNATRQTLAKTEAEHDSKVADLVREHSEAIGQLSIAHDAALRRADEQTNEERRRRMEAEQQRDALQEALDELNNDYDSAVTAMELMEGQLQENRHANEQAMAALAREMERNRTNRSHSVAVADAAEAEALALKAEVGLLKRQLRRNVCSRCGAAFNGGSLSSPYTPVAGASAGTPLALARDSSIHIDPYSRTSNNNNSASTSGYPSHRRRLSVDIHATSTPTNTDRAASVEGDEDLSDGKRYGASGDF